MTSKIRLLWVLTVGLAACSGDGSDPVVGENQSLQTQLPVSFELSSWPTGVHGPGAVCYATGPPMACDGCSTPLHGTMRQDLGSFAHGAPVSVTQAFSQERGSQFTYGCAFQLTLMAGTTGNEVVLDTQSCSTRSGTVGDPALLTCSISASGTVP